MKTKYATILTIICISLILITSCKKEGIDLIEGTWHRTKLESRIGSGAWQDETLQCQLDNIEIYEKGGVWKAYDGTNQCSPGNGITTGTWKLTASDTKVIYTYDDYAGEYESTVEELTENSLILTHSSGGISSTQFKTSFTR